MVCRSRGVRSPFDAAQARLADGTGTGSHSYTWDGEGRLKQVTTGGGTTTSFTYNGLGQQVVENAGGTVEDYAFDSGGHSVARYVEGVGSDTVGQFYLGDRLLGSYFTNYTYFMHRNVLGSENGVTNWVGSENGEELFNPLGVPWATVGSPVIWTFAGFEHGHTDIMQWPGTFREYDPNKGRWLSPDPLAGDISNPQSLNRYTYVLNQPTTLIDPTGLDACTIRNGCRGPGGNGCTWGNGCRADIPGLGAFDDSCAVDGFAAPCNVAFGLVQSGAALPTALVGTGAQLVGSSGGSFFFSYSVQIGVETVTVGSYLGESPIYGSSLIDITIPGIQFTSTGPTTATFRSQFPFSQTVQRFKQAGFVENPQDYVDIFHPGQLDLRDTLPFCSAHVAVDKPSGQSTVPTTGDVHLDSVNPWAPFPFPSMLDPGGLTLPLEHALFDVVAGIFGFSTASRACR